MYSRTNVANRWRDRSGNSKEPITSQELRACTSNYSPLFPECPVPAHADGRDARVGDLAVLGGNELRHDAHGNFLRCDGANVQSNRSMNPFQRFRRRTFLDECVKDAADL